ncbi:CHAT domain-containing protein [Olleya aquimaris]|uniref:CHAT domain-containing protein n=1 Tax=Olleya aquimaris TaxID=639310 RepID=A0A327RDI4_9FLAO|nr:CHAT domain-containing protein [Olleya aquimaris]RAJ15066.1 CHAT domain-containing protein [Olleya aquimaris]
MKNSLIIIFFFVFTKVVAQDLEEAIYVATETFNANPNASTFQTLIEKEAGFKSQIKTKDQYFAYLNLLVNKGYYLFNTNQQTQAITAYENAWTVYKSQIKGVFKYDITELCLKNLSTLYNRIGDYTNAENIIKQYIFLSEKEKNNQHRISGAINLAQLYFTIGKHQSAIEIANNGLQIKGISKSQIEKLQRIKANSQIASLKITTSKDAIVLSTKQDNQVKYQLALKNKDYQKALSLFHLKYLQIDKTSISARELAKLQVEEAQLHFKLNDFNSASKKLKIALNTLLPTYNGQDIPKHEDLYADNTFIDIFDLLAQLQSNFINALACYDRSFYVSELLQDNITSQEAKLIHLNANRRRSEACINLLFNAYKKEEHANYLHQAFAYAEKNKASILKESIDKKSLLQQFPNDSLLLKEQTLLQQQEQLTNAIIKAQYQNNSVQINKLSQDLTETSIALKQLKKEIDNKYPNSINKELSIKTIQDKLLKDNAVLVEYFYGETAVFQFLISPTTIDLFKIERDDHFNTSVEQYIDYFNNSSLINNNIQQFTSDAYKLYKLLRFENTSTYKNVVVIPDSFLNFIPFESFLSQETTTTNYSKMPFVATQQQLAYNVSASFYLTTKPFKYSNEVLGVFPVFDKTDAKLTYSINEAESIEKEVNAKFLMYDAATKQDVLSQANQFGILHLSTHASSGTFTIPANIDFIDQKLFLNELYSLNLQNNLVVLSACETGIGKLQKGEGSMNLARGFQYAGVENLLFSLWKINDLSTSQLMASFYKNYSKQQSAFVANHLSKVEYLNNSSISNIKKSPYYWSAFVYYGDLTPQTTLGTSKYLVFAFVGLGIALLLWIVIRRRNNGTNT